MVGHCFPGCCFFSRGSAAESESRLSGPKALSNGCNLSAMPECTPFSGSFQQIWLHYLTPFCGTRSQAVSGWSLWAASLTSCSHSVIYNNLWLVPSVGWVFSCLWSFPCENCENYMKFRLECHEWNFVGTQPCSLTSILSRLLSQCDSTAEQLWQR